MKQAATAIAYRGLRQFFCRHNWKKSRFQFQALNSAGTTTTFECSKCGKTKYVESK